MGVFHKTLSDLRSKVESSAGIAARRILNKHIEDEHDFQSELSGLQGAINAYQNALRGLQPVLEKFAVEVLSEPCPELQEKALLLINEAERNLNNALALIRKIQLDAKYKLR